MKKNFDCSPPVCDVPVSSNCFAVREKCWGQVVEKEREGIAVDQALLLLMPLMWSELIGRHSMPTQIDFNLTYLLACWLAYSQLSLLSPQITSERARERECVCVCFKLLNLLNDGTLLSAGHYLLARSTVVLWGRFTHFLNSQPARAQLQWNINWMTPSFKTSTKLMWWVYWKCPICISLLLPIFVSYSRCLVLPH